MQTKIMRVATQVLLGLMVLGLGWLIRERSAATHATHWIVAGWALTALLVLRAGLALNRAAHKIRRQAAGGVSLRSVDALAVEAMPSFLRGFYAMEKRAYRGAWRSLCRAPLAPAGQFSVSAGPRGRVRGAVQLLTLLACAGLLAFVLPGLFAPFWPRIAAAAGLLVGVLYALVWIMGARRSLQEGGHRIDGNAIVLDLGLRASAVLALQQIGSCTVIEAQAPAAQSWRCTPGETPNVALQLLGPVDAVLHGNAQVITAPCARIYVDAPDAFIAAVRQALATQPGGARDGGEIAAGAVASR